MQHGCDADRLNARARHLDRKFLPACEVSQSRGGERSREQLRKRPRESTTRMQARSRNGVDGVASLLREMERRQLLAVF